MRNSEVAKLFSAGQRTGRSGHVFIEEDTIYSWGHHFPIAKRILSPVADYLFNSNNYSRSTACHKSHVRNCLSGTVMEIEDCDEMKADTQLHRNKILITELNLKLRRARKRKEFYKERIEEVQSQNLLLTMLAEENRIKKRRRTD